MRRNRKLKAGAILALIRKRGHMSVRDLVELLRIRNKKRFLALIADMIEDGLVYAIKDFRVDYLTLVSLPSHHLIRDEDDEELYYLMSHAGDVIGIVSDRGVLARKRWAIVEPLALMGEQFVQLPDLISYLENVDGRNVGAEIWQVGAVPGSGSGD